MISQIVSTATNRTNGNSASTKCNICNVGAKRDKRARREHPLTRRQRRAILLLIQGHTDDEIAQTLGIHRSTLWRWRGYHPTFQTELNRQRQALWLNNTDRLRSLMTSALDILQKHMASASERSAFRAAVSILRLAGCNRLPTPAGPTDEYDLLEQLYLNMLHAQDRANSEGRDWPPDKSQLDEIRDFLLHRAHNLAFTQPEPQRFRPALNGHFLVEQASSSAAPAPPPSEPQIPLTPAGRAVE